nr:MAG: hypothetical protein [Microviridae sp.]
METDNFFTPVRRPPRVYEVNSGEIMVELTGYIPPHKMILELLDAGLRLAESRRYEFEDDAEVPEGYMDPTRSPGYDLADATQTMLGLEAEGRRHVRAEKVNAEKALAQQVTAEKADGREDSERRGPVSKTVEPSSQV